MIFPDRYKEVGFASAKPCGDRVYFLSRYLIHELESGFELLEVIPRPGKGLMRDLQEPRVLAGPDEVTVYPERVRLHDRARLIRLARETGRRGTIFTGIDDHCTFVLDPDLDGFLTVRLYDVIPPRPSLSATVRELEELGLFSGMDVLFEHNLRDISQLAADTFPCRAAGFSHTLDSDLMLGGERVAGCLSGAQLYKECYGKDFELIDICPLSLVSGEPFLARCCRKEREGVGEYQGRFGAIVHWGASPRQILAAVEELMTRWREAH
jgi:hypothetical protein